MKFKSVTVRDRDGTLSKRASIGDTVIGTIKGKGPALYKISAVSGGSAPNVECIPVNRTHVRRTFKAAQLTYVYPGTEDAVMPYSTVKYTLCDDLVHHTVNPLGGLGKRLVRIKALKDIPLLGVKAGDYGGWVESFRNLSQRGNCWIAENAMVYDYGSVAKDALVSGNARVYGNALVTDTALVTDNAKAFGGAIVGDSAALYDYATIYERVKVSGEAVLSGTFAACGDTEFKDGTYTENMKRENIE